MIEYRIVRINENWNECSIGQTNILTNVAMLEHQNIGMLEYWDNKIIVGIIY